MKKIAILLTSYNRCDTTINCLTKIQSQIIPSNYSFDIYLVIDGSTDKTEELVKAKFPLTNIIKGTGELFWNRGMHLAWETASTMGLYYHYLWMNDDTELKDGALNSLIRIMESKNDNAIVVGSTCSIKDNTITTYGGRDEGLTLIEPDSTVQECHTFNGNCVLIPHKCFIVLGNLDYYFRHSFGDIEYGLRANRKGISIFTTSQTIGHCNRNEGTPAFLSSKISLKKRLKILYSPLGFNPFEAFYLNRKYHSLIYALMLFIKVHLNSIFPTLFYKER